MEKEDLERLEQKIDELTQKIQLISEHQNSQYTDIMLQLREVKDQISEEQTGMEPLDKRTADELYEEALKTVLENGKASTSYLQRKMGIGYARAAQLIDMLEEKKIISEGRGAKPREVLIKQ